MKEINDYQANSIKTIYGHDTYIERDNVTNNEILDFYQKNMNYNKTVEIPDKINSMCHSHKLTDFPLTKPRTTDLESDKHYEISYIAIDPDIIRENKKCYKLLSEKELNWEYAYLPNLLFKDVNLNRIEYNVFEINTDNNNVTISVNPTEKLYDFDNKLPNNIYNTYDLMKVIDYLLLRIKVLYFLLGVVKDQKSKMNTYQTSTNIQESNNQN